MKTKVSTEEIFYRVTIPFTRKTLLAEARTCIMIDLDHKIKKWGYI